MKDLGLLAARALIIEDQERQILAQAARIAKLEGTLWDSAVLLARIVLTTDVGLLSDEISLTRERIKMVLANDATRPAETTTLLKAAALYAWHKDRCFWRYEPCSCGFEEFQGLLDAALAKEESR
jgi:hypothetical protein